MAKGKLTFDYAKCKGCGLCAYVCPVKILRLNKESVNIKGYNPVGCIDIDKCIACGSCAIMCPDSIIKVEKE
ncbi:MAG: 4Fe-4S binding protein [Oscillospiraceae bacterium]|nr:4Fe-4S binding protein [Oscillospiraceae bacterium]